MHFKIFDVILVMQTEKKVDQVNLENPKPH